MNRSVSCEVEVDMTLVVYGLVMDMFLDVVLSGITGQ